MLTSNMKKLQCERWKTGPKVLGGDSSVKSKKVKSTASGGKSKGRSEISSSGVDGNKAKVSSTQGNSDGKGGGFCATYLQSELGLKGVGVCHYGKECRFKHKVPTTKAGALEAIESLKAVLARSGTLEAAKDAVSKRFSGK
jgi:hypothetical protein